MKKSFVSLVVPMAIIMALIAAYIIPSVALAAKPNNIIASLYDNTSIGFDTTDGWYQLAVSQKTGSMPGGGVYVDGKVIVGPVDENDNYSSIKITLTGLDEAASGFLMDGKDSGSGPIIIDSPNLRLYVSYDWKLSVGKNGNVRFTAQAIIP